MLPLDGRGMTYMESRRTRSTFTISHFVSLSSPVLDLQAPSEGKRACSLPAVALLF